MNHPLLLKGAPGSPYTRKMLALLRYRHIAYSLLIPGSPRLDALPVPKVELLPTFYLPNAEGKLEAVTDSTPLLRRFEAQFPGPRVQPPDPVIRFLDSVLEDYADEWLTKPMFHYRWHFAADAAKSGNILPRWRRLTTTDEVAAERAAEFSSRQIGRLHFVGSNPTTAEVIEQSYLRFLAAFEAHLAQYPYLMGARPGASDFGFFGQLTQLAHFDPTPSAITLAQAPRVFTWTWLTEDLSGLAPTEADWITRDAIPPTLLALLAEAGRTYVPLMLANARALKAGAERVKTEIDGRAWVQNPFPYQGKCLRWLREEFAALGAADQKAAMEVLEAAGCGELVSEVAAMRS